MLEQPGQVARRLETIERIRLRWMETAGAEIREDLAGRYEDLSAVLKVHLRRQVTEVMPVVDKVMPAKELAMAAEHGSGQFDMKFLVAYLGMLLATNTPGEREEFFKEIPAAVRLGYRLVGRRMYRRQYSALFPGRVIPETLQSPWAANSSPVAFFFMKSAQIFWHASAEGANGSNRQGPREDPPAATETVLGLFKNEAVAKA